MRLGLSVACAFLLSAAAARADDESDRVAAERLGAIVHDQARIDQGTRTAVIGGTIAGGVAAIAVGVPLLVDAQSHPAPRTTNEEIELAGGGGFIALGGVMLVIWPLAFIHSPAERLDARIAALSTLPPSERLARAEAALSDASDVERSNRRLSSVLLFVCAALEGANVALDIATNNQPIALVNGGIGVIAIIAGAIFYANAGPMERMWRTWRAGTGRPVAHFAPTANGFALTF